MDFNRISGITSALKYTEIRLPSSQLWFTNCCFWLICVMGVSFQVIFKKKETWHYIRAKLASLHYASYPWIMLPSVLRCSSGFDRNRQDWVDLGCLEEVVFLFLLLTLIIQNICLDKRLKFFFPEKRSSLSPNGRRHERHISPPHAHNPSCYSHHDATEELQHGLHPHPDIPWHQLHNTQQHEKTNTIHTAASYQQTCRW